MGVDVWERCMGVDVWSRCIDVWRCRCVGVDEGE